MLGPVANRTVRRWLGEAGEEAAETAAERAAREAAETASSSRLVPGGGLLAHETVEGGVERGHTPRRHVGRTPEDLQQRLIDYPGLPAASTFLDRATAEDAVSHAIDLNQAAIDTWIASGYAGKAPAFISPYPNAGLPFDPGATESVVANFVQVVLRRDPGSPLGYYILTSFPTIRPPIP